MSDSSAPTHGAPEAPLPDEIATPELVASLLADGDDELAAWAIGQALLDRPRAAVFDDVVRRAMELVGTRWETRQWTISEEHLASVSLAAALGRIRPADEPAIRVGPVAVLAGPEGEHHVSGLACLAQVLEEQGWQVHNLGANVPADDLVRFISNRTVDLVALSLATEARIPSLRHTLDALRGAILPDSGVSIMVGGRGVRWLEPDQPGVDLVSASLVDAERFTRDLAARLKGGAAK